MLQLFNKYSCCFSQAEFTILFVQVLFFAGLNQAIDQSNRQFDIYNKSAY